MFLIVLRPQKICNEALEIYPWGLKDVPYHFKMQEICDKAVEDDPFSLQYVPDWFVSQEQLDVWLDDDCWCHDDELSEWYEAYKKRKTQKAKIKEGLLSIAWHPDHVMYWCMSEDEKGAWK